MCGRITAMRKFCKALLIGLAAMALLAIVAIPVAVPPIAERILCDRLCEIGIPRPSARVTLGYCWRNGPGICGEVRLSVPRAPWRLSAEFGASCCEWSASAKLPQTAFDENDAMLRALLEKHPLPAVTNLTFSGAVGLDAKVERTFGMPVPVWSARAPVRVDRLGVSTTNGTFAAADIALAPEVSGIGDHVDLKPLYLRARAVGASGFALTNFYAAVRAEEWAFVVTEAGAELCGGKVNLYSLFLNPTSLSAGLTLFVDDVEAGDVLSRLNVLAGQASGRLHGKVRLFVREGGRAVSLSDAFLYSTPGETGKLRLKDPTSVTANLALAGLDEAARNNVADALTDLDYTVLRLDLKRGEGGDATLSTVLRGTATRGELTVPVNLTYNIHGQLEQIINTGLGYANLLKGNAK